MEYLGIFGIFMKNLYIILHNIPKNFTLPRNFTNLTVNLLEYLEYCRIFGIFGISGIFRNILEYFGIFRAAYMEYRSGRPLSTSELQNRAQSIVHFQIKG